MKKTPSLIVCLTVCLAIQAGRGQDWNTVLTVDPYPSPFLSDWQTDPTMAALEITNPTGKPDVVILDLNVSSSEGVQFQGTSQRMLVNPEQTLAMNSTEFNAWYTGALDADVKDQATRSGMMPEGSYQACVTVKNLWGIILAQNVCAFFTIVHPEPPELIYPIAGLEIVDPYPVFQWIPPQLPAGKQIVFVFRMVRVMQGQTPEMALSSNYPHYENFNVFDSNLEYPLDGLPLEPDAVYAWQVQALDFEGKPLTKNEGRSVIGIFAASSELGGVQPELQLLSPQNQAVVTTALPEFQWIEPVVTAEGPLHYTILIAEVRPGQTPEQALTQNTLHFSEPEIVGQTSLIYPANAPVLVPDVCYAWQVQVRDGFGNPAAANEGLSTAWTFTPGHVEVEPKEILPDRLPLVGEAVAYLELKRNGQPVVNYTIAPDSLSIVIQGPMTLVVPALQTGSAAPHLTVHGQITFHPNTLEIAGGQVQGDTPAQEASPFNLNPAGVPLIVTQITYTAGQSDQLDCKAIPILFGRIAFNSQIGAVLSPDGSFHAALPAILSESIPVVPNSDKLVLNLKQLMGTIQIFIPSGAGSSNLSLEADFLVSTPDQTAGIPVLLEFSEEGAETRSIVPTQQSIGIDLGSLNLGMSGLTCNALRYNQSSHSWFFDLGFDLAMEFDDLGVTLPTVPDVHMSRLGIEIPAINVPDLGVQNVRSYGDLWIKPRAFRMYSYTFNWIKWMGPDIGDWGFFWDVDIQLPHLPQHLSALDQTPFRANNATYVNGALKGSWNTRTFEPALFVPLSDSVNWGLTVHEVKGSFPQQVEDGVVIGVQADWVPPDEVQLNPMEEIIFSTDQLRLSPKGIFTGQLASIALSNAVQWGTHLSIRSQSAGLTLGGTNGKQTASLGIQGSIVIPARSGETIEAVGEGTFDLFTWHLDAGQFRVQNTFTFDLPWPDYLIGLECESGAILDPQGLHAEELAHSALLTSGDPVSCQSEGALVITLPGWELASGTVLFKETFGLSLSQWRSGRSLMKWQTLPASGNVQSGIDNLFMPLPNLPRMDGNALIATGTGQSVMHYRGLRYELDFEFSYDFLFSLTPTGVKRGQVQFSVSGQNVAVLDSSGLHLGEFFGETLATAKIGLPDTLTAYISLEDNPNLSLTDEGGLKRIRNLAGQSAVIHFPALTYQSKSVPAIQAQVDLLVDPSTYLLSGGSIEASGKPLLSLVQGEVPLEILGLDFQSGKWTASVQPVLPLALRQNHLAADSVSVNAGGLQHFDTGYSNFAENPQDSVVLGDYLTVTLDGIRCIAGGAVPAIAFSGDFRSPVFNGHGIHFTSSLTTDSASFTIRTLNVEPPLGCGILSLLNQDGLPKVEAPMNRQDLVLTVYGLLKLDSLSTGFALTLPRLEIRGSGITLNQPAAGFTAQSLKLFGTEITVNELDLIFSTPNSYDLALGGSMLILGKSVDFTGLHIPSGCSVADGVLAQNPGGVQLNLRMVLRKLEAKSGNLLASLGILQPQPFDYLHREDTLSLAINTHGQWLDTDGNPLGERKWTVASNSVSEAPRVLLGNAMFSINAYLTGITLELSGQDNTGGEGSIGYQVDTYWPAEGLIGAADSIRIQTDGLIQFNATNATESWSFPQDAPVDTVTTVLDNRLYMHAATFSMADTSVYQIHFNCVMQLPLPADIINGEVELTDNRLGFGLFETGKLHTAKIYVAGVTLELLDFHYARNEMVDFSEIEFTRRAASVESKQILADLYLSFGANLETDWPGFQAGIERFVIFKSADQFHLLIKHATLWIGEKFFFDLDLVGSIWEKEGEKTQFKWLVGGNLDVELGDYKGGAIVGEVSYRETVTVNNQVEVLPGFGLFASAKFDIDLTPIPVKLTGFGAGFFFNPSKEVRDLVYYHVLGYDESLNQTMREEFQAVIDATQDDMMTLWEIYLYGAGAIPSEKSIVQGIVLLTLATDRIGLNAKVVPQIGESSDTKSKDGKGGKKIIDLSGWIEAECAWKQDFSAFKYLAGHFKIGGRPATDEKYILKFPETVQVQTDFIVTAEKAFAIAGRIQVETLGCQYLTAMCDFTLGNPGFVFSGSVGFGYNMYILYIEAGLDMTLYLKWLEPVKFGISADCYVQGAIISDWLCGFRGEMGAALVVEPELFLYGYAELTGTILGVSNTLSVWAKWEDGGGMSSGTGPDPTMEEVIAEAKSVADEIMSSLVDLRAELDMLDVLQYGGLTDEDVQKIIQNLSTGLYDQYIRAWDEDYTEFSNVVVQQIEEMDEEDLQTTKNAITEQAGAFFDAILNLRDALTNEGFYPLLQDMQKIEPSLAAFKTSMQNRVERLQSLCDEMAGSLDAIDFALDTLLVLTGVGASPIQNPFSYSTESIEGINAPVITFDESIDQLNNENIQKLQQALEGWLVKVESNIQKIRKGREEIYARIGPDSPISTAQGELSDPLLSTNTGFVNAITELNGSFGKCYGYYGEIPFPWNADDIFRIAAEDRRHRQVSNARRLTALSLMGIPTGTLPVNEIDQYRVLGNLFYRRMPQVILRYYVQKADSLMLAFEEYAAGIQSNLDKIHQSLTSNTDLIWDKYAELSEGVYGCIDMYRTALKNRPAGGENLVLADSVDILITNLEKEFTYPTVSPVTSVTQTRGFLPVTVTLDCQSDEPDRIAEYAVSLDGGPRQSMGAENRLDRDVPLRHAVTYWFETDDGGVAWPIGSPERRSVSLSSRLRNQAGLAAPAGAALLDLSGNNWKYGATPNTITVSTTPDSMYRCLVHWPYPGVPAAGGSVNVCNLKNALTVQWSLQSNFGIWGYTPVPVKHIIELKQGGKTVFGPETFPVTQTEMPDTFQVRLEGLDLEADTGEPVHVIIHAYDISDVLIGTSSGSADLHGMNDDGSIHTVTQTWEAPPLYIDTSPPVIAGSAEPIDVGSEQFAIYRLPKAGDKVVIGSGDYTEWISDPAAYEYQLLLWQENPDSTGWQTLDGSDFTFLPRTTAYNQDLYTMRNPGSGSYFLNFASRAFSDSLKYVVRARHEQPLWNTGTSEPGTFLIPKADESVAPTPATFKILGLDANKDLEIQILQAGTDDLSGVSHYPWRLIQNLYRSKNPIVYVWQPESLRFPADTVQTGAVLTIPIPRDSIDVNNAFTVELYTFDHCGNVALTQQEFQPGPIIPDLTARILEGMKPYTLTVTGAITPLSENYIDSLVVRIGTAPDASDILTAGKSFQKLYLLSSGEMFVWPLDMPAAVAEGTSIYLSAFNVRSGQASVPYTQRIQIYQPMFQAVETDADGYLVLPIVHSPFNGQKEVAAFKWALGFIAPSLSGQNRYQLNIQPLTSLQGTTSDQIVEGNRIRLPIRAGDVLPVSLVVLQATALDGEIHATYREAAIVPPKPELKAVLTLDPGDNGRFFYRLNTEAKFGTLLQTQGGVLLKIGSGAGLGDIRNTAIPLVSYLKDGFTSQEVFLGDTISQMAQIHLTAFSKTGGAGVMSKDSTTLALDVPWPAFWKDPKVSFDGNLTVVPLRPGYRDANEITGYQFAVGDGEGSGFTWRPYPGNMASVDIPSAAWHSGETLELPFPVTGLSSKTYRVGIRAVLGNGQTNEQVLTTQSFLQPIVDASIIEAFPQNKLRVQGNLGPGMVTQMSMKELRIELTLGGSSRFYRNFTVPDNGVFDVQYDLPDMPLCETYQFKSYFWHTASQQFAMYVTGLDMPCEPMFTAADADSQDMLFMDIIRTAFNGSRTIMGYQFAIGSSTGAGDIRAFPAEGQFDYTPGQVQAGKRLTLPQSLVGIPSTCFVSLRGIDGQGKIHLTEKSFEARPPKPKLLSLGMNRTGRFTAEFDRTRFDGKVRFMDLWIQSAQDPNHVIAFKEIAVSDLQTGIVKFDSGFTETDLGQEFKFEGLNLGYQINSLNFLYRFRIEKEGDNYRIVPVQ